MAVVKSHHSIHKIPLDTGPTHPSLVKTASIMKIQDRDCSLYNIGIKDTFECFMMVLNYRAAVLKPRSPKAKMVTLIFWSK